MTSNHPETTLEQATQPDFRKVGENLYRLESTGGYYGLLKRGGKQFRRSLKTKDRKLALRKLAKLRKEVQNLKVTPDARLDFEALGKKWLNSVRHTMKPSSAKRRETCLKALNPFFKGISIRNVAKAQCERWLTERGGTIAPQTFAHELDTLKSVLAYALEHGLILDNPAATIKRRRIVQARIIIPSRDEFQKLLASIRQSDGRPDSQAKAKPGADLIELMAYSGMRLREATSLTWGDIDFEKQLFHVRGGEHGTKNGEERTVPMAGALRELLQRLRLEREVTTLEQKVAQVKDAKTALRKACNRLKLPQFSHHDFRHLFATTCIESDVDIPTIARWLGHKDGGALAMKVYGHLRNEHSQAQIRRVSFAPLADSSAGNLAGAPAIEKQSS